MNGGGAGAGGSNPFFALGQGVGQAGRAVMSPITGLAGGLAKGIGAGQAPAGGMPSTGGNANLADLGRQVAQLGAPPGQNYGGSAYDPAMIRRALQGSGPAGMASGGGVAPVGGRGGGIGGMSPDQVQALLSDPATRQAIMQILQQGRMSV